MKIFGFSGIDSLYTLTGIMMGFGIGIIFSNAYPLSIMSGVIIFLVSFISSIFIWNKYIKK